VFPPVQIEPATTPTIFNVAMPSGNTEYSQALPANTKKFTVSLRESDATYRLAFEAGRVAAPTAPFLAVPVGGQYFEDHVRLTGMTLFFACPVAGKNVQIIAWV
jgi:hypothetical protein